MIQRPLDVDRQNRSTPVRRTTVARAVTRERVVRSATTARLGEVLSTTYDLDPAAHERVLTAGLLLRAREMLLRELDSALSQLGTSHARYQVLGIVCRASTGVQLSDIANRASVHQTTITSTLDRLQRDGLMERQPDPRDRRSILAIATPKGRALYEEAHARLAATAYGLAHVDSASIRSALDGLDHIVAVLEREDSASELSVRASARKQG